MINLALGKLMKVKVVIMVIHREDAYDMFDLVIKVFSQYQMEHGFPRFSKSVTLKWQEEIKL